MRYCIKCRAVLRETDDFCRNCGTKVGVAEQLTAEDSIALAQKLESKYRLLRESEEELADCEKELKRLGPATFKSAPRYSAFRFFWPSLIFSQLAGGGAAIVVLLIAVACGIDSDGLEAIESPLKLIIVLVAGVYLIIASIFARKKRDRLNAKIIEDENYQRERRRTLETRIIKIQSDIAYKEQDLRQYDNWIPDRMRNAESIRQARLRIESGELNNLYEAVLTYQNKLNKID